MPANTSSSQREFAGGPVIIGSGSAARRDQRGISAASKPVGRSKPGHQRRQDWDMSHNLMDAYRNGDAHDQEDGKQDTGRQNDIVREQIASPC